MEDFLPLQSVSGCNRYHLRSPLQSCRRKHSTSCCFHIPVSYTHLKRISLSSPDGSSGAPQTLQVHIPAGIDTGKSIRLKGQGMTGTGGGEPGDLLLKVTVGTRPGYERKGSDV